MLKATHDFTHAGVSVKRGDKVAPLTFEADEVDLLIRSGLLEDDTVKAAPKPPAKSGRKEHK